MFGFKDKLCKIISSRPRSKPEKNQLNYNEPVDVQDAIDDIGFGKFNLLLLFFCVPNCFALYLDSSVMANITPSAKCDLNLSMANIAFLNCATHIGMILTASVMGHFGDTIGRRKIILVGMSLDCIFNFIGSFSVNFWMLAVSRVLSGASAAGSYTIVANYVCEFDRKCNYASTSMIIGTFSLFANIMTQLLGWVILKNPEDVNVGFTKLHGWQIFLLIANIPNLVTTIFIYFLPESPVFLAFKGRNDEALDVLKTMYCWKTGKSRNEYQVKELKYTDRQDMDEIENIKSNNASFLESLRQFKPLFRSPFIISLIILNMIEFGVSLTGNTLRLWLPQLLNMMSQSSSQDNSLCEMISLKNVTPLSRVNGSCVPIVIKDQVFESTLIVASATFLFGVSSIVLIRVLGKKLLLLSTLFCGSACTLLLYWSQGIIESRNLLAVILSVMPIASNTGFSFGLTVFPSNLSGRALSTLIITGRVSSIIGNNLFPKLLEISCLVPFATISSIVFLAFLLALALPNKRKKEETTRG